MASASLGRDRPQSEHSRWDATPATGPAAVPLRGISGFLCVEVGPTFAADSKARVARPLRDRVGGADVGYRVRFRCAGNCLPPHPWKATMSECRWGGTGRGSHHGGGMDLMHARAISRLTVLMSLAPAALVAQTVDRSYLDLVE